MLALCLMLSGTYYARNYAGIIGASLYIASYILRHIEYRDLLSLVIIISISYLHLPVRHWRACTEGRACRRCLYIKYNLRGEANTVQNSIQYEVKPRFLAICH